MINQYPDMSTIEQVINDAYVETERVITSKNETLEEKTNRYLDAILEVQADLRKLVGIFESLNDSVENYVSETSDKDNLTQLLVVSRPLIQSSAQLHHSLYKSKLYPGIKSLVKEYFTNLEYFRELNRDALKKVTFANSVKLQDALKNVRWSFDPLLP